MTTPLIAFIRSVTACDPAETLLPLTVGTAHAGWLRKDFAERLEDWPALFTVRPRGVALIGEFATAEHRSAALAEAVESLAEQDVVRGWRGEQIAVSESFHDEPLLYLERAASRHFGVTVYAAHLNGFTVRDGRPHLWLAERSASKHIDPGKLDSLAAGRIARGDMPHDTVRREAFEEAGILPATTALSKPAGAVRVCREVPEGFEREIAFVYDLILPATFVPENRDGEVARFQCVPVTDLVDLLREPDRFTADAVLVIVDCLIRRGYFHAGRDDYLELIHSIKP